MQLQDAAHRSPRYAAIVKDWLRPTVIALLAVLTTAWSLWTLEPHVTDGETDVSLSRLRAHLEAVASEPRPVESAANARARAYILDELESLGLEPRVETSRATSRYGETITVSNIVAEVPGHPASYDEYEVDRLLICVHYDSREGSPGAGDDGLGVASLLETARLLMAEKDNPWFGSFRGAVLLFTDGEELGLVGAEEWVKAHPDLMRCSFVLNFDARGTRGPVILYQSSGQMAMPLMQYSASPQPVTSSFAGYVYDRMPNGTDFSVFREAGMSGLNFAVVDGFENYHMATDTPANVDDDTLLQYAQMMWQTSRRVGSLRSEWYPSVPPPGATRAPGPASVFLAFGWPGGFSLWLLPMIVLRYGMLPIAVLSLVTAVVLSITGRPTLRDLLVSGAKLIAWIGASLLWGVAVSYFVHARSGHPWARLIFIGLLLLTALIAWLILRRRYTKGEAVVVALAANLGGVASSFLMPHVAPFAVAFAVATLVPLLMKREAVALGVPLAMLVTVLWLPMAWLVLCSLLLLNAWMAQALLLPIAWVWMAQMRVPVETPTALGTSPEEDELSEADG